MDKDFLHEGGEWVCGSTDLAKKSARISDFEDIFYGLADFEGLADHGLLQYFSVDYGFCLFLSTDGGTDAFPVQKKGQSVPLRTLAQAVEKVGHSQCKVVLLSLSVQCVT